MIFFIKIGRLGVQLKIETVSDASVALPDKGETIDPWDVLARRALETMDQISTKEVGKYIFGVAPLKQDWQFSRRVGGVMTRLGFELVMDARNRQRVWRRKISFKKNEK